MARDKGDVPGVVAPPPVIFGVPLAAALYENTSHPIPLLGQPLGYIVGGVTIAISLVLFVSAALRFRKAGTPLPPYRPSTAFVRSGPFAFSRNPVYLSLALLYTGISFLFNSAWPLLLLPLVLLVMQRGVILREEAYLERKFGDEYLDYKSRVRRWI